MSMLAPLDTGALQARSGPIPTQVGIGLRFQHHQAVIEAPPSVAWMEVHTENYLGGGTPLSFLNRIRRDYPISCHGVGLSLGSAGDLDPVHLERIADAIDRIEPVLVSEHLSWSRVGGMYLADLLPLPLTEESLEIVCRHVDETQAKLKRKILIENPSSYLRYVHSTIPEWEYLVCIAERTGCGILCDVNNIFVSAHNLDWDAGKYLASLKPSTIGEIHLAGHSLKPLGNGRHLRLDDHGSPVCPEVWDLYGKALLQFGPVPTLIEWDNNVPALEVLVGEAEKARFILRDSAGAKDDADAA